MAKFCNTKYKTTCHGKANQWTNFTDKLELRLAAFGREREGLLRAICGKAHKFSLVFNLNECHAKGKKKLGFLYEFL